MLIARVVGEVIATEKHATHRGRKALLVQPLNLDGTDRGNAVVALDAVDAGIGDRVLLVTEGYSAMTSVGRPQSPIDMAVIGVIDCIDGLFDSGGSVQVTGERGASPSAPLRGLAGRGEGQEFLLPSVPVKKKPGRKTESQQ
ncbi:MAG: EutN/CcmL family microcompartment protein [Acidobacteria bacterium]|nr:EutN/CcmL family microcompartment protein [Acidobacteriota bacterium]